MANKDSEALVLTSKQNGIVVIPMGTELTRLNYFDGKFLRASDLKAEQDYLRALVQQSNQANGSGVAHGFDVTLGQQDTLNVGPGLAIDAEGRVLLMPQGTSFSIQNLINKSRELEKHLGRSGTGGGSFGACEEKSETPAVNTTHANSIYKIVISAAEALCGEEDVYGKLCEEACSTSTDRPLIIEGVVVRAIPLEVPPILKGQLNQTNLRSRTAAAYFEFERTLVSSLISGEGLKEQTWCRGANPAGDGGVPIGVIARAGTATVFLDPWIARRELIDTPAKRYWQWRMMMRPWDVFLAQILQFQCQLRDLYKNFPDPGGDTGPCGEAKDALNEAAVAIAEIQKFYEATTAKLVEFRTNFGGFEGGSERLLTLNRKLASVHNKLSTTPTDRWLINGGIIELPSAGYLPVVPGTEVSVNQQVRKMMGEGVDLRFCVVRPDFVAHALEAAQHMERISLIDGLENAAKKPEVDILVPDGEIVGVKRPETRQGFAADADMQSRITFVGESRRTLEMPSFPLKGAARPELLPSGGTAVHLSAASPSPFTSLGLGLNVERWRNLAQASGPVFNPDGPPELGLWLSLRSDKKLLGLQIDESTNVSGTIMTAAHSLRSNTLEFRGHVQGLLTVDQMSASGAIAGNFVAQFSITISFAPPITGTETFRFTAEPSGNGIKISINGKKSALTLVGDWSNPSEIRGTLSCVHRETPPNTFEFRLPVTIKRDESVFSSTNTNHILAVTALEYVARPLRDQNFVAEGTNLLFPAGPAVSSGESFVRATREWVLFHRRRTKRCNEPAISRRYRVYQFAVTRNTINVSAFERKSVLVKNPVTIGSLAITARDLEQFKAIGEVEFGAGVATFAGDITALKNAWQKIPGGGILWGAIGNRGDAVNDGESLSLNRLKTLQAALDKVSPSVRVEVLPTVPAPLDDPNFDGVILLINGLIFPSYYDYYGYYGYYGFDALHVGVGGGIL